jgi:hypothetical protein
LSPASKEISVSPVAAKEAKARKKRGGGSVAAIACEIRLMDVCVGEEEEEEVVVEVGIGVGRSILGLGGWV